MTIGFLTCPGTAPGSPNRRADAFEHDLQVAALRPALAAQGLELREIDWRADLDSFDGIRLLLIGTAWDYQDDEAAFLDKLDALSAAGIIVCNPPGMVRWNARKTYLRELAASGAATIPTLWFDHLAARELHAAFDELDTDQLVIKRQIGANSEGQHLIRKGDPIAAGWNHERPVMIQPFLPAIVQSGEISFIFIGGGFSHALVKRAAKGDYRVQSSYGGTEAAYSPTPTEICQAADVLAAIPHGQPLYARIDMVKSDDGDLLLMEAELIEPYLYPLQGPLLGMRMTEAIVGRLGG